MSGERLYINVEEGSLSVEGLTVRFNFVSSRGDKYKARMESRPADLGCDVDALKSSMTGGVCTVTGYKNTHDSDEFFVTSVEAGLVALRQTHEF